MATWSEWVLRLDGCTTHMQVTKLAAQAYKDGAVNAALAARIEQRHAEITAKGARIVRVHVLRRARNAVAKAAATADPYADGYGLIVARKYLTWLLGEERRAAGLERPVEGQPGTYRDHDPREGN